MTTEAEDKVMRYLRYAVQDHPLRGQEYLESLLAHNMSRGEMIAEVLAPARRKITDMQKVHYINPSDAKLALVAINREIARLTPKHSAVAQAAAGVGQTAM
jgi:hypothetical protein